MSCVLVCGRERRGFPAWFCAVARPLRRFAVGLVPLADSEDMCRVQM